ncbi:MAG: GIY-YIG nuclease family protein [Rhodobiaceae bacterium]|nr:GIY-YIG nuclease family protein [Rhodobiaceae bacterium]
MAEAKSWYLYILECAGKRLYTGIAVDVDARFHAHVSGKGARFTKAFKPKRIAYTETHADRSAASSAEHAMKKLSADQKWALIAAYSKASK